LPLLIRFDADQRASYEAAGRHTPFVDTGLHDGRRLAIAAGDSIAQVEKRAELAAIRAQAKRMLGWNGVALANRGCC
jgi:hypothetical protein